MRWGIGLWIACLWACNPINGVKISGNLLHYKGNKLYFEVCGQDTTIAVALDSTGAFFATGEECSLEDGCKERVGG